jgi:hypothetical protein
MRSDRLPTPRRRDGVWPRVYRPTRGYRVFIGGLGALALAGSMAAAAAALLGKAPDATALVVAMSLLFGVLGAFLIAAIKAERVLLFEDGIEFVELGRGRRRLRTDEIAGRRTIPLQYGMLQHVFEFRDRSRKPFKITLVCERDAALDAWFAGVPDLDEAERARAEAELLRSVELGADEPARRAALVRARRVSRVARGAAFAAAAWGFFHPRPYTIAVVTLAVLPLAAMALLVSGRGRYAVQELRGDARPSLDVVLVLPGMVLMVRALTDYDVVDLQPLLAWTALASILIAALLALSDPALRRRWFHPAVMLLLMAPYPAGALTAANALLDRAPAEVFRVAVVGKRITSGKRKSCELRLAAWGPREEEENVEVGRALYREVEVGDTVCVQLRPGALGVRWFQVKSCE